MPTPDGSTILLLAPLEVRAEAVEKAAPAARAAAARVSRAYRRAVADREPDPSDERR